MKITGIDYSITSPAVCTGDHLAEFDDLQFYAFTYRKKKAFFPESFDNVSLYEYPQVFNSAQHRYDMVSEVLLESLTPLMPSDLITFEGYAYSANGNVFDIAEATSVMKMKLYRNGNVIETAAPTEIKKHATGKGTANKLKMLDAFLEKTGKHDWKERFGMMNPEKIPSPLSDIVDAYWIRDFRLQKYIETMKSHL